MRCCLGASSPTWAGESPSNSLLPLLIRIDGILYAVDTSSTNGLGASPSHTLLEGMRPGRVRFATLDSERWLDLAGGAAQLGWQPLQ
jgi:hypothetical protein